MIRVQLHSLIAAATLCAATLAYAQAPAGPPKQRGPGGPGRGAPVPDDNAGFQAIFDGKTLNNWDCDKAFWRVENGSLIGETSAENVLKQNTFVIWRGGTTADFELKLEYKITTTGNSGVQYRSVALTDVGPFVLKGYQADIDGKDAYTGLLYEERGRGFLSQRGQFVRMAEGRTRKMIGSPGEPDALKAVIKSEDWNQVHIIARGNTIIHVINGRVMSLFIDEDAQGRSADGLLGLQLHVGPPMKVEFRNVMLRKL